jgi:hypothetical protein
MQDEMLSQPLPLPRRRRSVGMVVLVALLGFALGGAVVGWLVHSGHLPFALPKAGAIPLAAERPGGGLALHPVAPTTAAAPPGGAPALDSVETRLALIEDRLSRIDGEANAASGNAARAEALLIALAARRRIEQGRPLGYVEDQLKLRFANAQPRAVQTLIAAARAPVTLAELDGQLEAAAPALAGMVRNESTWTRMQRELANLFVVRRAPVSPTTPNDRITRARLLLASGKIEDAVAEVERMPYGGEAKAWIDEARRYADAQRALEVIETTAMLEPNKLEDGTGRPVEQPSPLASPAAAD